MAACGSGTSAGGNGNNNGGGGGGGGTTSNAVIFTPVGDAIAFDLIDLEFLPGKNGEAIAIGKDGSVYYLNSNFQVVGSPFSIDVLDSDERGLLGVVADPLYASNGLIYLYYTRNTVAPNTNRVERYHVDVNVAGNTFTLTDPVTVIEFDKTTDASNHNGGSMVFMDQNHLAIGVGDGGDTPNTAQDENSRLGKIHRVIPNRDPGVGGFTADNNIAGALPEIYSFGVRNPFTLILDDEGDLFMGDVGSSGSGAGGQGAFEEINCIYQKDENYGWPICEGPCVPNNPNFVNPLHGYRHGDETFNDEDPEDNSSGGESILVSAYYLGSQYGGLFTNKIIYNEFFKGWVRLLSLNIFDQVTDDQHIGHLQGLTGLHENPADGLLYGTSLGGSDHLLRMDLIP